MSWKFVFNTRGLAGTDFEEVKKLVAQTNYSFFTWNNIVWMLMKLGDQVFTERTYIDIEDLF